MQLSHLSDTELVTHIEALCLEGHRVTARLVAHLAEVEERRLALREGYSSMLDFCQRKLGMSVGEACRRLNAARLARKFPSLWPYLANGTIGVTTLYLLRDYLTPEKVDEVAANVVGKTQPQIADYLAQRCPRPDAPTRIVEIRNVEQRSLVATTTPLPQSPPVASSVNRVEPLSESRFKVQVTVGKATREKLERARDLMRHRNPTGDLGVVLDQALDLLLSKLEKERLAKTSRPARKKSSEGSGRISSAARREVFERDGEQCTFISESGVRCPSREWLELDHVVPRAHGGSSEPGNLRVRCRPHNQLYAEEIFGREHIAERTYLRQRKYVADDASGDDAPGSELHREAGEPSIRQRALFGLTSMGFARNEANDALRSAAAQAAGNAMSLESLLRAALGVLTP